MPRNLRVLHLGDCAFVGLNLVCAAARAGDRWDLLPPSSLEISGTTGLQRRLSSEKVRLTLASKVSLSQVIHVHYATTAKFLRWKTVPSRPYVLHLHGSDIRQWDRGINRDQIQEYIDHAAHVFYSTPDLAPLAARARADAELLPILVDAQALPSWSPDLSRPIVIFTSRWDPTKGATDTLEVARRLKRHFGEAIDLVGLDWGEYVDRARSLQIRLVPRLDHARFLRLLSRASIAVGQSNTVLGVSEIEAMGIGLPLGAVGEHLAGPDGTKVPVCEGDIESVTEQVVLALSDPVSAAHCLGGKDWVLRLHSADSYVAGLRNRYSKIHSEAR